MIDIKNLTLDELKAELKGAGEPAYRAEQIFDWLYKKGALRFEDMTNLGHALREKLKRMFALGRLELQGVFRSKDRAVKYLFRLQDGRGIETVLIPAGGRATVCLSTQVGCKFGCAFCASGLNGFTRNLTPSEIVGQVLFLRNRLDVALTNIVFMGMGEPLDNFENLAKAILILNSADGLGIAARRMTISSVGVIPGLERFMQMDLQVNLSISLHAAGDAKRTALMPANMKYPLEKVIAACEAYGKDGGRKITLEYVLLKGVNDAPADAAGLARIAKRLKAKINLIPYSPVIGLPFETPEERRIGDFTRMLEEKNVPVTLRRSKGRDIQAACGQLAGKLLEGNPLR
ncbi:MAG: 23S rRNA (adenine(2503)-C(2))-methyltransferase RlmN [Candidatus Aminicenantales bacterium]